jgi:hypothetical protein
MARDSDAASVWAAAAKKKPRNDKRSGASGDFREGIAVV